jgi:hypothetical protein
MFSLGSVVDAFDGVGLDELSKLLDDDEASGEETCLFVLLLLNNISLALFGILGVVLNRDLLAFGSISSI